MIKRSLTRTPFGKELARQGVIQDWIANARINIEQARLLVLKAAWIIDNQGAKAARKEIAAIKVAVPRMAQEIIDHAIQHTAALESAKIRRSPRCLLAFESYELLMAQMKCISEISQS